MISEHETWSIIDSSKIQDAQGCLRYYFFKHILGWVDNRANIHLEFGAAVHLAMEHLLLNGYKAESIADAYSLFEEYYRSIFPPQEDAIHEPKTPSNFLRALPMYANQYRNDNFEVINTEIAGTVLISTDKLLYYKSDSILRCPIDGIISLEHKTGTRFTSSWANQWIQKIQVGTYTHVLYCLFKPEEVYGVKINALFIKNPPARSNSKDCEFMRVPVRKSLDQMEDWLWHVNWWYDSIKREVDILSVCKEDDIIMEAFPKRTENCDRYFGCLFNDYCTAWPNPLRHCGEPPIGFRVEFWDPRNLVKKARKEVNV